MAEQPSSNAPCCGKPFCAVPCPCLMNNGICRCTEENHCGPKKDSMHWRPISVNQVPTLPKPSHEVKKFVVEKRGGTYQIVYADDMDHKQTKEKEKESALTKTPPPRPPMTPPPGDLLVTKDHLKTLRKMNRRRKEREADRFWTEARHKMSVLHLESQKLFGYCEGHEEAVEMLKTLAVYARYSWKNHHGRDTKSNPFPFAPSKVVDAQDQTKVLSETIPTLQGFYARWIVIKNQTTAEPVAVAKVARAEEKEGEKEAKVDDSEPQLATPSPSTPQNDPYEIVGMEFIQVEDVFKKVERRGWLGGRYEEQQKERNVSVMGTFKIIPLLAPMYVNIDSVVIGPAVKQWRQKHGLDQE